MKKLMVAVAFMAAAWAVQASTVKWGLNNGQALDTEKFASATAYLIQGSLPDTSTWSTATTFTESMLGGTTFRTGTMTDGVYVSSNESITSPVGSSTVYMAVISDDGKYAAVSTSTKTMKIAAAATPMTMQWASSAFTTYTAVPEPTSGLLMLLGMAGLALKRKRA